MTTDIQARQTLIKTITQLVIESGGKKWANVKPNDPLLSGQTGFDSFGLMEFVLRLEDSFDMTIPDEDLDQAGQSLSRKLPAPR